MSTPFIDLNQRDLEAQSAAQQKRSRFRLINSALARNAVAGDEGVVVTPTDDERNTELAHVLALGTDAASFVIADLAACPGARAFVDAVMGATGGSDEFVFIKDEQLAERIGKSTKTVQNYRKEFRAVKNYSALIEVKENYQTPDGESFPHRYRCKLTALAVEAMQNAQLMPGWSGNADDKMKAMKEAAETVARGASVGPPTKKRKRRTPTDAEVVASKLKAARSALEEVKNRRAMVRNPDFDEIWELAEATRRELMEVYAAFDFGPPTSTQIQEEESGSPVAVAVSDEPVLDGRVEAEKDPQVENFSTRNDSTESTTCRNGENSSGGEKPPDDDALMALYVAEVERAFDEELTGGKGRPLARKAAIERVGHFKPWKLAREQTFDRAFCRLGGGERDG